MEYYINPMWFYWLSVSNGLRFVFGLLATVIGFGTLGFQFWYLSTMIADANKDEDDERYHLTSEPERRKAKPYLKALWAVFAVCLLGWLFMPSRNTLIEMMVAKQATVQNAESAVETIKSAVDYVIQAIQNDK